MTFDFTSLLADRRDRQLYRSRLAVDGPQAPELVVDGQSLLSFCSNDYLGLASDPRVTEGLVRGAARYGVGAGASHLVTGHSRAHHRLEEELAEFVGAPRALLFSTGYMANLGVVSGLLGRGDAVFEDRQNHASLIDAGLLTRATLKRYAHGDTAALSRMLQTSQGRRKLIATDGVFSMDGDLAPLPALLQLAERHQALLLVDDAHGLGVLGETGRGTPEHYRLPATDGLIHMGTLGKGLGTFGAFVAGSESLVEWLVQEARTYIYTTAMPPALAEATRVSLRLVREEPWRRQRLQQLVQRFRDGARQLDLPLGFSTTPIQPLILGDNQTALRASRLLRERGILVTAIRPPTVPVGTARLRITLSAAHRDEQVDRLLEALEAVTRACRESCP